MILRTRSWIIELISSCDKDKIETGNIFTLTCSRICFILIWNTLRAIVLTLSRLRTTRLALNEISLIDFVRCFALRCRSRCLSRASLSFVMYHFYECKQFVTIDDSRTVRNEPNFNSVASRNQFFLMAYIIFQRYL